MVQGMAFLSKKGFNPQNNANRKQVWEAEQKSKLETERIRKRREQLQREKEDEELEIATRGEIGGSQAQLRFMYDAPPGMETSQNASAANQSGGEENHRGKPTGGAVSELARVKPGDDAAAVAFRRMLAASAWSGEGASAVTGHGDGPGANEDSSGQKTEEFRFTPSLQGSTVNADARYNHDKDADHAGSENHPGGIPTDAGAKKHKFSDSRSALEKEVGRKNRSSQNNLSYEQQIERFPQLKNAPMAIQRKTDGEGGGGPVMVNFKPLGAQILHVRCLACGIWGHARGDRECKKSGWNPFALPSTAAKAKATGRSPYERDAAGTSGGGTGTSSILPPRRSEAKPRPTGRGHRDSSPSPRRHKDRHRRRRRRRHRERYHSDGSTSEDERHRRRRRHRGKRGGRDSSGGSDSDSDASQQNRGRRGHRNREERFAKQTNDSDDEPSSENSSKLKRRNDDRYEDGSSSSSGGEEDARVRSRDRTRRRDRDRDRRSSKKSSRRRSKRHESSSSSRKKKKRRRHDSP